MGACHVSPARHCVHFTLSIHSSTLTLSIRINFFRLHQVFTPTSIFPPASLVSTLINFVRPRQLVLPGWFCNVCINIFQRVCLRVLLSFWKVVRCYRDADGVPEPQLLCQRCQLNLRQCVAVGGMVMCPCGTAKVAQFVNVYSGKHNSRCCCCSWTGV